MQLHDTIVAISSPPGPAARGIVRLSGPDAHRLTAAVFDAPQNVWPPLTLPAVVDGRLRLESGSLPAAAWMFAAPRSYTRQDMVELHTLGSPGVLGLIVEALISAGTRRAEAGEFTARAYLNGALDLAQVHGVAAVISAQSEGQRRAAARLLEGSLSRTAHAAREELADLLSLVEGALDFADEPIEFITPPTLLARLASVSDSLRKTLDAGLLAERWDRAPRVLLAGRPNAGKSSLLNRLSAQDRAIATPTAGTTRDTLTAALQLGALSCVLIDSAGLTDLQAVESMGVPRADWLPVNTRESIDSPDTLAIDATLHAVENADLLAWIIDATEPVASDQLDALRIIWPRFPEACLIVLNKSDIADVAHTSEWSAAIVDAGFMAPAIVSANTGAGCDELCHRLAQLLQTGADRTHESPIALLGEHHDALKRAVASLDRAMRIAQADATSLADADLVALELHAAADALGVLVGKDVPDDLLGRVFARFCVGK